MKIIYLGDLHFRFVEPFLTAQKMFSKWFKDQEFNNSNNYLIQLGDVFDSSSNSGEVNKLAFSFFEELSFKKSFICKGNHDEKIDDATKILDKLSNLEIVRIPKVVDIEDQRILFLPHYYSTKTGLPIMREYYSSLPNELTTNINEIVYHIDDETNGFSKDYDFSYIKCDRRTGGHLHVNDGGNFVGTPVINRYDEREKDSFIKTYDLETKEIEYIEVPRFLDYYDLDYEKELEESYDSEIQIFNIFNSPFNDAYKTKFENLFVRQETLKEFSESIEIGSSDEKIDTNILIKQFFKENKTSEDVVNEINKKIGER